MKSIPQIPITEDSPQTKRISWWIENTLVRSIKRILNSVSTTIRNILSFSITDFIEDYEKDLLEISRPFLTTIVNTQGLPEFVRQPVIEALSGKHQAGLVILAIIVPILAQALSAGISAPIGRIVEAVFDRQLKSRLIDSGTLVLMWQRNLIDDNRLHTLLEYNGLNLEAENKLKQLATAMDDDSLLTQGLWRKKLSETYVREELAKRGMTPLSIDAWIDSRKIIPSPSDLIAIAVREGFNDDTARRFGYDENYPSEAAEWAEKQGMEQIWFKRAWRAHWVLPGLTQVREMYNRQIIGIDDVNSYMIAADIPSFWRSSLLKWFKAEVTRVDLRRMFSIGVISPEELFKRYLKLGYTETDAKDLTDWTVLEYYDEQRQLTKSDVLSMYQDGVLNPEETVSYLTALNFSQNDIILLLTHRDLKRQEKYERDIIANTKKLFIAGIYNRTDVFTQLGKIDTPGGFIEESLNVWDLEKTAKISIPTITQLKDMALQTVITVEEFTEELVNKGYTKKYINWYKKLWLRELM